MPEQSVPQAPPVAASWTLSASQPVVASRSQSRKPVWQLVLQELLRQAGLALSAARQEFVQVPQCAAALERFVSQTSVERVVQWANVPEQLAAQVPDAQ